MKIALVLISVCVIAIGAENPLQNGVYDYHRRIGIPTALKIKLRERQAAENAQDRIVGGSSTTTLSVPYQVGELHIHIIYKLIGKSFKNT